MYNQATTILGLIEFSSLPGRLAACLRLRMIVTLVIRHATEQLQAYKDLPTFQDYLETTSKFACGTDSAAAK